VNADGDIIVTATRFETLASKTPIALTAVSGDTLRTAGITNPTNLGDQVPSVMINRNNGLQITIRGVTSSDGTEKGDPSAAFMMDGVYIARQQAQEVLRHQPRRSAAWSAGHALWPQHHGGRGQPDHQPPHLRQDER
jgi:iron complex outermembrane receptor protein